MRKSWPHHIGGRNKVPEIRPDQLPASTILIARSGKFFVYEPGLGVIASGQKVEEAYERFGVMRQRYFEEVESAGLTACRPLPRASGQGIGRELSIFFLKVCIFVGVLAAIVVPLTASIGRAVEQTVVAISSNLSSTGSISLKDVAQKAADIAKDAQDLPPEKKEILKQSLGVISRELKPFVDAWRSPPNPPDISKGNGTGSQQ
jgi:hypothetical protein